MHEFPDMTQEQIAEFQGSKPGRAAQQFLVRSYPTMAWTARSFVGDVLTATAAFYTDGQGNAKVLRFEQRGIAWLVEEDERYRQVGQW